MNMRDSKELQKSFMRTMIQMSKDMNESITAINKYGQGSKAAYFLSHKEIKDEVIITVCGGPVYYHINPLYTDEERDEARDKNISVVSLINDTEVGLAPGVWYWGFFDGKSSTVFIWNEV